MKFVKPIFFKCSLLFPLPLLKRLSPARVILPYHHLVCDTPLPHIRNIYAYKNVNEFRKDLDYLLRHFQPIGLDEILRKVNNGDPIPKNSFFLTFDDGLREVHDVVAPILSQKGIPAAFFLNPDFIDNHDLFFRYKLSLVIDRLAKIPPTRQELVALRKLLSNYISDSSDELISAVKKIQYPQKSIADQLGELLSISYKEYLQANQPFLTTSQIKTLLSMGFHVGAHSMDHPYYKLIPEEEQIRQTLTSCHWIASKFDLPYKIFAFPHLDMEVGQSFFERLNGGGRREIDLIFGNCNQKLDVNNYVLHRFNCENPDIPISQNIHGILLYNILNKMLMNNVVKRERLKA